MDANDTLIYSSGTRLQRVSAGGGGTPEPLTRKLKARVVARVPCFCPANVPCSSARWRARRARGRARFATGEQKILIEGAANPMYASTGHVVFVRGTTLMAARFNLAELTVTGEPVALLQGVRHNAVNTAADYALSATGTLVYVPGREENVTGAAVVWVDRNGRAAERAVSELVTNPRNPKLSPDGGRLVLTTGEFTDGDVWTYDLGGRPPIPLAVVGNNRNAVWSPDGAQVAFASGAPGTSPDVYVTRGRRQRARSDSLCVPTGLLAYRPSGRALASYS